MRLRMPKRGACSVLLLFVALSLTPQGDALKLSCLSRGRLGARIARGTERPGYFSSFAFRERYTDKTSPPLSLLTRQHHPHPFHSHEVSSSSKSSKSSSSSSKSRVKRLISKGALRRRAAIRVTIATTVLLMIISSRPNIRLNLKLGVAALIATFLGTVEQSRSWVARTRARATELWQSVEAHMMVSTEDQESNIDGSDVPDDSDAALEREKARQGERITLIGTAVDIGLTVFKLIAGIVGKSSAMLADAGHSLSDLASDVVTLWTVRIARLPADDDHPYGHGRFEALGALAVAGMLATATVSFGTYTYESFVQMMSVSKGTAAATVVGPRRSLQAYFRARALTSG